MRDMTHNLFTIQASTQQPDAEVLTRYEWVIDALKPAALPFIQRRGQFNSGLILEWAEDLKEQGFRLVSDTGYLAYKHDERKLCVEYNASGWMKIIGRDLAAVMSVWTLFKEKYGQENTTNPLKLLVEVDNSYRLVNLSTPAEALETDNYSPAVIRKFEYLSKQLVADKPGGRIGVLSGYPGTGKTYLIRAVLNRYSEDTDFVLINTGQCISLSHNLHKFMEMLASRLNANKKQKLILILEDADSAIAPRSANNLSAIQSILNFSDGLMGEALDIRLLVTTNVRTVEIDPAILRPGRLITHIDVGSLEVAHANQVFKRLSGQDGQYKNPVTLAQVYQDARALEETKKLAAE